jgi:hypothetical protein
MVETMIRASRIPLIPLAGAACLAASLSGATLARDLAMAQAPRSPIAAPARDGNIAIEQELDAARRAGTREAYDLFIARHPDHLLARTARQERERLAPPKPEGASRTGGAQSLTTR